MSYIHRLEYCSTKKRNKVLRDATMCMDLENIMQNERKLDIKSHILYDSIHKKCPEQAGL